MNLQKVFFDRVYRRAKQPSSLPWHQEEPPELLAKAALARKPGRALDLGCGTGTYSVWLAERGWEVTGIDFVAGALEFARERAKKAGVDVRFERADVLEWAGTGFDMVVDSGCLHSLPTSTRALYRKKLFERLAPGGDYLLSHFEKRGALDIDLAVGPKRRTRDDLITELAPLRLVDERSVSVAIGPMRWLGENRILYFWFRRD